MNNAFVLFFAILVLSGCSANRANRAGYFGFIGQDLEIEYTDSLNQEGYSLPVSGELTLPVEGLLIPIKADGHQRANQLMSDIYVEHVSGSVRIRVRNTGNQKAEISQ